MPLIRGHHSFDDHFTQIPNDWVRDNRLSLKSIGLLVQIMSHTVGWNMSIRSLAKVNGTGVDTIKTAVMELEQFGYLKRSAEQSRADDGSFADYVWVTSDPFQNPVTGKPVHGKLDTKNNNLKEDQIIKNSERTNVQKSEQDFLNFYMIYPKKVGKLAAQKAFARAAKRFGVEVILAGVNRLVNDPNLPELQYVPAPAVWLNQGRWDDAPYPPKKEQAKTRAQTNAEFIAKFKQQKEGAPNADN